MNISNKQYNKFWLKKVASLRIPTSEIEITGDYPSPDLDHEKRSFYTDHILAEITAIMYWIDPDCNLTDRLRVGKAIFVETGGVQTGLELWDQWLATGNQHPGYNALESLYKGFSQIKKISVNLDTLKSIAAAYDPEWEFNTPPYREPNLELQYLDW